MEVIELPLPYLKELASQLVFISVFLCGFSASLLGTLITSTSDKKILKRLIIATAVSALSFIVVVFAMTKIIMISTPGFPFEVDYSDTTFPRTIGFFGFLSGILSLVSVISMSGWMHSKRLGIVTTVLGVIGLILMLFFLT